MPQLKNVSCYILLLLSAVVLMSCSSTGKRDAMPEDQRPFSDNQAVVNLIEEGRYHAQYGEYALAKSKLERALRIEPQNPFIWYELAQVNYAEENFAEARNLAQRALSLAGAYQELRQQLQQFISTLSY